MGRLQFWLQGHGYPPPYRPWALIWLGNQISSLRYWWWRARGSKWPETTETIDISWLYPNATSSFTVGSESNAQSQDQGRDK